MQSPATSTISTTTATQATAAVQAHAARQADPAPGGSRCRQRPGKLAWGLLALLLCLAALLALPSLLQSSLAQQVAQHWFRQQYQRELSLSEPWQIHWQGAGRVRLVIKGVTLSEAANRQPMLQLAQLSLQLALPSLLQQRLELAEVVVRDARLRLRRDARGHLNIADLLPDPAAPASPWQLSLAGLSAQHVRLEWQDEMHQQRLDLALTELSLGPLAQRAQGALRLNASLSGAWPLADELQHLPLTCQLSTRYDIDLARRRFALLELQGLVALTAAAGPENPQPRHWRAELQASELRLAAQNWQAGPLSLQLQAAPGLLANWPAFTGRMSVTRLNNAPAALELSGIAAELGLQQEAQQLNARLAGQLVWQWPARRLDLGLTQLDMELSHPRLKKPLPLMAQAGLQLELGAASAVAPALIDARLQLSGELAHSPTQWQLNYTPATPAGRPANWHVDARLARLDVDAWLKPEAGRGPSTAPRDEHSRATDHSRPLPFALSGRLHVDALTLAGLQLRGVDFSGQAMDNWLQGFR